MPTVAIFGVERIEDDVVDPQFLHKLSGKRRILAKSTGTRRGRHEIDEKLVLILPFLQILYQTSHGKNEG